MNTNQKSKIEALKYAVFVCNTRKTKIKSVAYSVACDEIKLFLEAAIERVKHGEDMQSYVYTQENSKRS